MDNRENVPNEEAMMIEETEDLRQAAEQSQRENVLVELTLDNIIKWVSSSWQDVIGSDSKDVVGRSISKVLVGDQRVFDKATDIILADDAHSLRVRFMVALGDASKYDDEQDEQGVFKLDDKLPEALEMEGQGILVRDDHSGNPTHTMWVFRPYTGPHQTPAVDFDDVALVEALGVGAQNLDRYLQSLVQGGATDPDHHPPPLPVLCHICDRQIQPWFFERHSELCFVTHDAESMVEQCQDNLRDHRQVLDEFTNMFEDALHRKDWDFCSEYRGVTIVQPIKQPPTPPMRPISQQSHHNTFPGSPFRRRMDPSRQQSLRLLTLLDELCTTALDISRPAIKDEDQNVPIEEIRLQSPTSESRMIQVIHWTSPTPDDEGLALLCQDTLSLAQAKVDAVNRLRNVIIYAERIRQEINVKVDDMIQAVLNKESASPDQSDEEYDGEGEEEQLMNQFSLEPTPEVEEEVYTPMEEAEERSSAEVIAVKSVTANRRIASNIADESSGASLSPRHSPTPRKLSPFKPNRITSNPDEGNESDASIKSGRSAPSRERLDLPDAIEFGPRLGRKASLYGSPRRQPSPNRQISPSRHFHPSPLKPQPHRVAMAENSPLSSPVFLANESSQPELPRNLLRRTSSHSDQLRQVPLSPRMPSVSAATRPAPPSIKDFDVIKPISKGAFGSVYLTRKKSTGDYYAIKALKKADMIVKNQVSNVRAERAILMAQGESPFVAKLFFTFQTKDFLYLVMEYLNGGDCAALIKNMRGLPELWAKKYIAEVVLGVEYLHQHGIVHRDLKPDNLLIDSRGHLKLTDFGLSRMGLIGRQRRANEAEGNLDPIDPVHQGRFIARPISRGSSRSTSYDLHPSPVSTPVIIPETPWNMPSYFNLPPTSSGIFDTGRRVSVARSFDAGDEGITSSLGNLSLSDSKQHSRATSDDEDASSDSMSAVSGLGFHHLNNSNTEINRPSVIKRHSASRGSAASMQLPAMALFDPNDKSRKFVGTPDYLAPETIDGSGQDGMVDWWAVGCILFEFLYGYPPFHDESPEKVFENILARRIDWPEVDDDEDASDAAKDIMNKLMCIDSTKRLGAGGAEEVKSHPFFADINWDTLCEDDTPFVPAPEHPEDTDYFDSRGLTGTLPDFPEEETSEDASTLPAPKASDKGLTSLTRSKTDASILKRGGLLPLSIPPHVREQSRRRDRRSSDPPNEIDFGSFVFKNLPVLEKANKDTIERLRAENASLGSPSSPSSSIPPTSSLKLRQKSISTSVGKAQSVSSPSASSSGSGSFFNFNSPPSALSNPTISTPPLSRSSVLSSSYGSDQSPINPLPSTYPSKVRKPSALLPSAIRDDESETSSRRGSRSVGSNNSAQNSPVLTEHSGVIKRRSAEPLSGIDTQHNRRNTMPPRMRAASVSSGSLSPKSFFPENWKIPSRRRSQVFENSPSSSDTEEAKGNALLRVNQRREHTRRESIMNMNVGPRYRPLDVLGIPSEGPMLILVCEDNPVSRRVMESMISKLGCRVVSHADGAETVRCAVGDVKFDIIFTELKLPKIQGDNVARMIRGTENINSNTPIVAVTSYALDAIDHNLFDAVIEKPVSPSRLTSEIEALCYWKPPPQSRRSSIRMQREPSTPQRPAIPEDTPSSV